MTAGQVTFALNTHNPDVLSCIANLSSDEVFTPPELVDEMLARLEASWASAHSGASIWANPDITFLDPCTKSGIFLREIVARLTEGLADRIPDLQERVDHILTRQVFGIGITRLTALLARRSLYCSKHANGPHSIATAFTTPEGNIWFEETQHSWLRGGNCRFCGASSRTLDRAEGLESHAYAFIHSDHLPARLAETFGAPMHFDVIIGNPPYHLETEATRRQAKPIYQHFVRQAISLDPRYVCMVTPSRWMLGGMGLSDYRAEMLGDTRVEQLVDFIIDKDAFPKINANGGISYFLWNRDHDGLCEVTTVAPGGKRGEPVQRNLNEFDVFIRRNEALPIVRTVLARGEPSFAPRVSPIDPFGFPTSFRGEAQASPEHTIRLYGSARSVTWVSPASITSNPDWVDRWKVLVPSASDGNETYPLPVWDARGPFVAGPGSACTWSYLVAAVVDSEEQAEHLVAYMRTKFFRYLLAQRKVTHHNKAELFTFIPDLPLDRVWQDAELYARYGLTEPDIAAIETTIREMELSGDHA